MSTVSDSLSHNLFAPLAEMRRRPSKRFRSQLVELGWRSLAQDFVSPLPSSAATLGEILEDLHLGSLIVDDVQDDSGERRNGAALHRIYGAPLAINVGNYLYFEALDRVSKVDLQDWQKLKILMLAHETLVRAHSGQALDLAAAVDCLSAEEAVEICAASAEAKTGALMALAIGFGAIAAMKSAAQVEKLSILMEIATEVGLVLQRYDDLGNLNPVFAGAKLFEDLKLRRHSWIWQSAAMMGPDVYDELKLAAASLPDESRLKVFLSTSPFRSNSIKMADACFFKFVSKLNSPEMGLSADVRTRILQVAQSVRNSYGGFNELDAHSCSP